MPDIPDRHMEIDAQGNPVRVLSRGSTVYEGMRVEKVRSWFVGPDGLTEPEREAARLAGVVEKIKAIRANKATFREIDAVLREYETAMKEKPNA